MDTKTKIIEAVWKNKAVKIDPEDPYVLTSGSISPIYIDCRLLISDVEFRKLFVETAKEKIKDIDFDILAGGATAGIPYAAFLAEELELPMIYVRKSPKGHGRAAQIEGSDDLTGKKVLLVEDLVTKATSKLRFIGGIKRAGGKVNHCLVFFDRQQNARASLKGHGVELISLVTLSDTLSFGLENDWITQKEYDEIQRYLQDSEKWEEDFKS